jgi:ribonuclease E
VAAEVTSAAKRRRKRGGRGRGTGTGTGTGAGGLTAQDGQAPFDEAPIELDEETLERRRGRERKGRPVGRYLMCVHVRPHATQIAVLEGRSLIEHYVSRPADDDVDIHGNIYLGKVQNVLPGMEAAFVDIGTPKNAVLYRGDVQYDTDDVDGEKHSAAASARIEQLLRPGQTVLCQVTKNPIGTKGARLTQEVSLAGRFVVLVPNSSTYGISKRLADDERKRLRRILDDVRPVGHGIIVRTAAEGATAEELRRDVNRLLQQWQHIDGLGKRSRAPSLLYREPTMAVRVIREEFSKDYRGVIIDDPALYAEVKEYVAALIPELLDRIELLDDPSGLPIFERHHIHEQLHKALDRKVWLPSGGSLIIERTEALTVIDVNTGKNVGVSNLEETVFRNNLEAAEEIARQLRLRDIGGIIVIDFIDMEIRKNREEVLRCFKDALARDKTRTQVFEMSELGLVEMTRKRVSEGLVESFSTTCPTCAGRGIILDESLL